MGVSRLLYWGAQSWEPHSQRGCCEAGACSGLSTYPAAHHKGNILVAFTYTSLSTGEDSGGKAPESAEQ